MRSADCCARVPRFEIRTLLAGTQHGDKLRLLDQGLVRRDADGGKRRGHHYVRVSVVIPQVSQSSSWLGRATQSAFNASASSADCDHSEARESSIRDEECGWQADGLLNSSALPTLRRLRALQPGAGADVL